MNGCTHPLAANYNPAATTEDGSCLFLTKVNGICYAFADIDIKSMNDKSFTLSWAVDEDNWVFYHDYIPDFYFSTREHLHFMKDNKVFTMNTGAPGDFTGTGMKKSFFVDIVMNSKEEQILDSLTWVTEVFDRTSKANEEFKTFTHLTIWNSWQCSGRIALSDVFDPANGYVNSRKTKSEWNFNDFRDLVGVRGVTILNDLFMDYSIRPGVLDPNKPWFDAGLFEDHYFIVRFEFDNIADKIILLHDVIGNTTTSSR